MKMFQMVNSRTVEMLDATGNVVEEQRYDYDGKLEGITTFKYDLDNMGNWVVKKNFDKSTFKGKVVVKSASVSFRKITYY